MIKSQHPKIIRISKQGQRSLTRLKKATGIENWNILCRWAFCHAVSSGEVPKENYGHLSNIEIDWHTFTGENEHIYSRLNNHYNILSYIELGLMLIDSASLSTLVKGITLTTNKLS